MKRPLVMAALFALAGCGAANDLRPTSTQKPLATPYGARATPTPAELLTPSSQDRPERSDELLKKSDTRRGDAFDLPPHN